MFDFRYRETAPWPAVRRAQYLLADGVTAPRSADVLVWPSAFDWGAGAGLPAETRRALRLDGIRPAETVGAFWSDAQQMIECARQAGLPSEPLVGVTLSRGDEPRTAGAVLLGHDVVDEGFLSGLLNEGFAAEEREALAARWASCLNEHHLFASAEDAAAFVEVADARCPEHAPHFVVRLESWPIGTAPPTPARRQTARQ